MAPRPPKPRPIVRRLYFQWRYGLEACISADRLLEGSHRRRQPEPARFAIRVGSRAASVRALDLVAQIGLFGKLKLQNCADFTRVEKPLRVFVCLVRRGRVGAPLVSARCEGNVRAATSAARAAEIPGVVLCLILVVIHAHSRRLVVGFAHEIPGACKFHCSLQWAVLILQANFGCEGSRAMLVRKRKRNPLWTQC